MRLVFSPIFLFVLSAAAPASEPKTGAAVVAADDARPKAEVAGDVEFLNALLLPGFSIGADGKVTSKSEILAKPRARNSDASAKLAAAVATSKALHPAKPEVVIVGDTAILRWVLVGAKAGSISSSDMFVYWGGLARDLFPTHHRGEVTRALLRAA
jgi:hypothetical protein